MAGPYDWTQQDPMAVANAMGISLYPGSPGFNSMMGGGVTPAAIPSPTQRAAATTTAVQSENKPYQPGPVQTPGGMQTPTRGGVNQTTGKAATSGQFPMPHKTSNEWFGGLDEYGALSAGQSPGIFWDLYGSQALGLEPGSMTAQFYNENYNPFAMSAALGYGSQLDSYDARLAAGTSLANLLSQPGTAFFDPGQMVANVLGALANPGDNPQFNQLSAIVLGASTPDQQLSNLISFLQEALAGAMPPDVLQAYMAYLQKVGMGIVTNAMGKNGIAGFESGGRNLATYLLQHLGPTGGL